MLSVSANSAKGLLVHDKRFDPKQVHRLEDPERLTWLPPVEIIDALGVEPGMQVADIGVGTGYFAFPLAHAVAPGRLFAIDVEPQMLTLLREKLSVPGAPANIHTIEGEAARTGLQDQSCDVAFYATVWHEIDDHTAALDEASRFLRSGGRIAILDWSPEATRPPGPPLEHRIARADVERQLSRAGWTITTSQILGRYTYLVIASHL
ncbi:MAG TPA: methyltransferase domain-containing protein [Clostridia bacterium]|nr:methyltransferase domain-containing protein [Clostridia bacterium]